jgi:hypothetical protein
MRQPICAQLRLDEEELLFYGDAQDLRPLRAGPSQRCVVVRWTTRRQESAKAPNCDARKSAKCLIMSLQREAGRSGQFSAIRTASRRDRRGSPADN